MVWTGRLYCTKYEINVLFSTNSSCLNATLNATRTIAWTIGRGFPAEAVRNDKIMQPRKKTARTYGAGLDGGVSIANGSGSQDTDTLLSLTSGNALASETELDSEDEMLEEEEFALEAAPLISLHASQHTRAHTRPPSEQLEAEAAAAAAVSPREKAPTAEAKKPKKPITPLPTMKVALVGMVTFTDTFS